MTFSIKSTLTDIAALALVGGIALAPLTAEARGTQGHFPNAQATQQIDTQFRYDERTPTVKTTTRARSSRSGVQIRSFGNGQFFGKSDRVHVPLSQIIRQRRDSVEYFNR